MLVLLEDPVFLVIVGLWEGLVDVYGAWRSGGPFADKEILYRKRREEPVVPGNEACSFGHGGRGERKVGNVRMIDWRENARLLSPSLHAGNGEYTRSRSDGRMCNPSFDSRRPVATLTSLR